MEGFECFSKASQAECDAVKADPAYKPPILAFDGQAIIGGYVYRGDKIPHLKGRYVFGDYRYRNGGTIHSAWPSATGWTMEEGLCIGSEAICPGGVALEDSVLSFGQDSDGELYVLTVGQKQQWAPRHLKGKILRIVPPGEGLTSSTTPPPSTSPTTTSSPPEATVFVSGPDAGIVFVNNNLTITVGTTVEVRASQASACSVCLSCRPTQAPCPVSSAH